MQRFDAAADAVSWLALHDHDASKRKADDGATPGYEAAQSGTGLSHLHWQHPTVRGSGTHPAWDYAYSALADAAGSDRASDWYGRLGDLSSEARRNEEYAKQRDCSAHGALRGLDSLVRSGAVTDIWTTLRS